MSMHPRWVRALAALALVPAAAHAQDPATTVFAAVGGGQAIVTPALPRDRDAVLALLGARRRVWRSVTAEGAVQIQRWFTSGDDAVFVCQPVPGDAERCRINELARPLSLARAFVSPLARVGAEERLGRRGPSVRIAAGGGYMTRVREPFASLAGGVSFGGRGARVALDVDRWWSRVDVREVTLAMRDPRDRSERPFRVGATSTFARLGVEVPVGARR